MAEEPHFLTSAHRANQQGVVVHCVDCHLAASGLVGKTWDHLSSGVHDVIAQVTGGFGDPAKWASRQIELAHQVRGEMRANDSAPCRSCHTPANIRPASERGRAAHALLAQRRLTCIDCHFNLVHAPVPPSADFLRGVDLDMVRPAPAAGAGGQ